MDALGTASAIGNIVTSVGLAAAGVCAYLLATSPSRPVLPRPILWLAAPAFVLLAIDEGLELHDRVGRWLYEEHGVVAPGPINHVDDLFVIAYLGLGAVVFACCIPSLVRAPMFLAGLVAAGALLAGGTALDALGSVGTWTDAVEEAGEAMGAVLLAAMFVREAATAGGPQWRLTGVEAAAPRSPRYQH
jgi:hypothetical protein